MVEYDELKKTKDKKKVALIIVFVLIIIGGLVVFLNKEKIFNKTDNQPEIITESSLYKIINVSELATYQCVYNDICTVKDEEDKTLYYCAYEAKVNAGIDFTKVKIVVEEEEDKNVVKVTIPKTEVTDVNVDIASLAYMFEIDSANTNTVSESAYKACISDVESKSKKEDKIYDLAQQNAENIITALIKPFIEQVNTEDSVYELDIITSEVTVE